MNNTDNLSKKITILIDAGHGGKDPGAIGHNGLQEKKVNIAIALQLKKFLDNDKIFRTILTRNNDSYLSLKTRKQFFKKNHVNLLISIHVDSSKKRYVSGASLWIISPSRMDREINNYLKNKNSDILFAESIQKVFNENKNDLFLKKTILDLQFSNFQKIEFDLSTHIFEQLKKNIKLHKIELNYASLGILSSINIPAILIETGFITNFWEEKQLNTTFYQKKISNALYLALKKYFSFTLKSK
ncbi:N-acetylmuramoyl-L-alanine amidase [Buchnera aphidicola (Diuraphis noxia)]|uniref:N-acetylmuramoyl-L-alanine amidase n=1 Tax=Buchnera aphidicola subsp. Diuraphis noxia TaxID=118101 RepID=A0A1B2H940_BUCDN|nr:N-acetylmuramoyl-L-alanine amidase [Buchnera aphidicola]ANZ22751.1 N-acetylmuramoyl-L-alanine amidase [Buchnera aphidicola (Diuraphis noxia)]